MRVLFTLGSFAGLARAHVDSHAGEADALALQMMHGGMTETSTDDASNAVASMEQPMGGAKHTFFSRYFIQSATHRRGRPFLEGKTGRAGNEAGFRRHSFKLKEGGIMRKGLVKFRSAAVCFFTSVCAVQKLTGEKSIY
jgi:hypothetical protein